MIGDFITRSLILVLGYAYPAFQCFKSIEKNRVEIPELRFWCQYWVIVAVITILEKIGDVFVSWLPMYGEMKLALFIYLWSPKTRGTSYVYETFLRPYVSTHETEIDRSLLEFRERAWSLAIYYWQNCTELGSTKIIQLLQYAASQSGKFTHSKNVVNPNSNEVPPPMPPGTLSGRNEFENRRPHIQPVVPPMPTYTPVPPGTPSGSLRTSDYDNRRPHIQPSTPPTPSNPSVPPGTPSARLRTNDFDNRRPPPSAPPMPPHPSEAYNPGSAQAHLHNQTPFVRPEEGRVSYPDISTGSSPSLGIEHSIHDAKLRLRRFIDGN